MTDVELSEFVAAAAVRGRPQASAVLPRGQVAVQASHPQATVTAAQPGPPGPGVPAGGATGQFLAKDSGADYDTSWVDQARITVSPTAPVSPVIDQVWIDTSS